MDNNLSFRIENIQPILSLRDIANPRAFYIDMLGFTEETWGGIEMKRGFLYGSPLELFLGTGNDVEDSVVLRFGTEPNYHEPFADKKIEVDSR